MGEQSDWLGTLPDGWRSVQLSEILRQHSEKVRVNPKEEYTRLGVRWYAEGPFKKDTVLGKEIKGTFLFKVEPTDFIYNRLFAWKGSFGVIPESMAGCCVSGEFPVFQVDRVQADPWFLWRWFSLPAVWKMIEDKSMGSTRTSRLRFKEEDLLRLTIPLPPLLEQHAIANTISTIQHAIEAQDKVLAATHTVKKSMMHHLLTYSAVSPANAAQVPLKETEGGTIPEKWETAELGTIAEIVYGAQAAVAHSTDKSIGTPIFTNINITNDGFLDLTTLRYYRIPESKRARLVLRKGDLLFNWRSGSQKVVGKTALFDLEGEYTFSSFILRFRPRESVYNKYLFYYLHNIKLHGFFSQRRDQSSINSVFNATLASKIPVAIPSLDEQQEISRTLTAIDKKIEMERRRSVALQVLFRTTLHQLMAGQIRTKD